MTEDTEPPYDPDSITTSEKTHAAPDGTTLASTVFRPDDVTADSPGPVLLQRTPYGRPEEPPTAGIAGRGLANGYAVVFEDTRGRGESDGEFLPWVHEGEDGAATVEWLAAKPWATTVGMFGGSSPGQVQLFAAAEDPDGLGAIAPTFTPSDLHRSDFFQDGAMSALTFLTWSLDQSIAGHTVDRLERRGEIDAGTAEAIHDALADALATLSETPTLDPFRPLVDVPAIVLDDVDLPEGIAPGDVVPHWEAWTNRPAYDEFWAAFDPERSYDRIPVPGLHTTGWYELCQHGTVTNYTGLRRHSPAPQHLVVGPWAHQNQGRELGEVDFGPRASARAYGRGDQLLAFFETYLRDDPTPPFENPREPLVETFRASVVPHPDRGQSGESEDTEDTAETEDESDDAPEASADRDVPAVTGTGQWVRHDDWPPADAHRDRWFLSSDGDAATDLEAGTLSREPPAKAEPADSWTHDPADPVPTRGGPLCCGEHAPRAGMADRSDLQTRDDVVTYTSEPLASPLELAGPVELRLTVRTTAPDTDVTATLTHVTADGQAYNLCEGIRRVQYRYGRDRSVPANPGEPITVGIDLWNVHYEIPSGDRLRLEVASSNAPRFDPHPGTVDPWQATAADGRVAEQTLFHELDRESVLTVSRR